jgi:cytochrome P450
LIDAPLPNRVDRLLSRADRESPAHARDDLLTQLIAAEQEGNSLDDDELIAMYVLLLFAGHETTTHLIANSVLAMLNYPSEFERLRAQPWIWRLEAFTSRPVSS